jgi:hypothetical protein
MSPKRGGIEMRFVPPGTPQHLDKMLRYHARAFDHYWERLEPLIAEAKTREIHKDLGFKSWPDYIADVARYEMPNVSRSVEQRRQIVALLAGEGMSQRAIAVALGTSQSTVRDDVAEVSRNYSPDIDVDQMSHDDSPAEAVDAEVVEPKPITGRDGKTYPKPKPKPQPARPVTFGLLARKLRDLNRIADKCLSMVSEFDFDIDESSCGQYITAEEREELAEELTDELKTMAEELRSTVEEITGTIDGQS